MKLKLITLGIAFNNAKGGNKESFHKKGKSFFRALVKHWGLEKGTYEIRSCLGGPAVMGEVILHTTTHYFSVSGEGSYGFSYWRTCKGLKDYCGGNNHPFPDVNIVVNRTLGDFK